MFKIRLNFLQRTEGQDILDLNVTFHDGPISITRTYNLHGKHFQNLQSVVDFLKSERDSLSFFDVLVEQLQALIGTEDLEAVV